MQFQIIHPFLEENSRIGRLLSTLLLGAEGVLSKSIFYLSLYFKRNCREYHEPLEKVRRWGLGRVVANVLIGVTETAEAKGKA